MNLKTGRIRFILTTTHLLMYISRLFMNSQTVCLFWKEKSSNMYGFSFHLVFFTKNWKVFITSILMKTAKDLEIIRGDIHIRICKHPYLTSVVVLPRLCCMRPTKSQISLHILISAFVMNTNIKHFVGPGLGQTCLLIISAADMKIKS